MPRRELFDITVTLIHETKPGMENEGAILIDDGKTKDWLPKAAIEFERNRDGTYTVTAPTNLLRDKGFI